MASDPDDGAPRRGTWPLLPSHRRVALVSSLALVACGGAETQPATVRFAAQCLTLDESGELAEADPIVCWLDGDGEVVSVSDIELRSGLPFVVDEGSHRVLGISRTGNLIDVTDGSASVVRPADPSSAYGFTADSVLVTLSDTGELRTAADELVQAFEVDGVVDVPSGVDIAGEAIAFTVERSSGNWAIVVGDMSTGATRAVFEWSEYVGGARWSPDATKLSFAGPDYRSIVVTTAEGAILAAPASDDPGLTGRVTGPRWIDDDRIVYYDSATALLVGTVSTDSSAVIAVHPFEAGRDYVPVLPVPVPGVAPSARSV